MADSISNAYRRGRDRPEQAALRRKVAFLSSPAAYPERPRRVEPVETHMSWVFLTDRHVYKLKKPVRYPFLDFATLEARAFYCREELRLNRRLAPEVYLDTVPLAEAADGTFNLSGDGRIVDWLVKMRRLPAGRMLDALIANQGVSEREADDLADLLTAFYARLEPIEMDPAAYLERYRRQIGVSAGIVARGEGFAARTERLAETLLGFTAAPGGALARRAAEGRLREGHGDLRPEHVCFDGRPVIIDCLEFNRDLRLLDPVDELAGFVVECERLNAAWIAERPLERYMTRLRDRPPPELPTFYKSFRALLRAKLAVRHADEPGRRPPDYWIALGGAYLALAERHAQALSAPPDQDGA